MADLQGKYVLESSENFDDFLKAIGVGFLMRKAAGVQSPTVEIKVGEDGEYTIKTITTFKTSEMKFKLEEEFDDNRLDGVTVKSKVRKDGDRLIQEQYGDKPCEIIREIEGDKLKTICTAGEIVSTRVYKRA